ncbi:MAG: hypothetical protein ACFE9R_06905 [Candidatus Hermodarchaeota archaeon]
MDLEFMTTKEGFLKCKTHSNFAELISQLNEIKVLPEGDLKKKKTKRVSDLYETIHRCRNCQHYIDDDCYFSKKEIKKIRTMVKLTFYHCKFCGSYVNSVYYVLYKKYSKNELNLTIPFLCCKCYKSMSSNDFSSQLKDYLIWGIGNFIGATILFIILYGITYPFQFETLLLIICLPAIFWVFSLNSFLKIIKLKISLKKSEFLKKKKG